MECGSDFSEPKDTFLEGLRTQLSRISTIPDALNEGMGINAAGRVFQVSKNTIYSWVERVGELMYALCHRFIEHLSEGDEGYTRVYENKPPEASEGWPVVLMDRASQFLWELNCGEKPQSFFEKAISTLGQVIDQTDELSLVTDGERRYGNGLFAICQKMLRTGKVDRPPTTLKKGGKSASRTRGHRSIRGDASVPSIKLPSENTPRPHKPSWIRDIHANHLEAFNPHFR